jgi:ATP-binding cassette, subfamily B, multidrug efflux pump
MYGLNLVVLFIIIIPYMFSVNATLAVFTLLPLPILSISIYLVSSHMNKLSEQIQIKLSGLSTFVQEAFSGIRVIKAFAKEQLSAKEFDKLSNEYRDESLKLTKINAYFFPVISTLIGLSTILTVYIGGNEVIKGNITIGNIAEFIIYVNILTWPVTSLGWITSLIQQAAASQSRINEFLDTESEIIDGAIKHKINGDISFKNVGLTYSKSGIEALKNISFEIKKGETLAILGRTGCGKSTLANLLNRMIDPTEGEIYIDDKKLTDLKLENYRSQLGVVPQESFLFSDTIQNNILFGNQNLTHADMIKASIDADLHENVLNFTDQYHTILGERGITLSGGQKQRVTIARAIIRNPKILVFDDCLSAVDTQTEDRILNSLKEIMENKTSIIISHRASTVKLADKILVLEKGKVAEIGTHEELYKANGIYRELYDAQLEE